MSDTTVPSHLFNLEAERAVLGVILGSPERLEIARGMLTSGAVFFDPRHQHIYEHVLKLSATKFDLVTLQARLASTGDLEACGGKAYLSGLRDGLPRASRLEEYVGTVHGLWRQRQAYSAIVDLKSRFEHPGAFADVDPIDAAIGQFSGLDVGAGGLSFLDGPAMSKRALELVKAGTEGRARGISTGFTALDTALGGGLLPGKLYVIGGRPGTGKTALVENISLQIARERSVCVFSQEMDADENIERFVAILAGVNMNRVRQGAISNFEYSHIVHAAEALFSSRLHLNDSTGITAHAVRAAVRREQARGELGVVAVDYLQMMSAGVTGRRVDRRDQELGDITKSLKRMAKDLKVPVLLVASLNRGSEARTGDKRPHLSDLRDSGEIESDADAVLFCYRDEFYNEDAERDVVELVIRKSRGGATGTVKLRFDPEFTRFREYSCAA